MDGARYERPGAAIFMLAFPLVLSLLAIAQPLNISHVAGLADDFSGMALEAVTQDGAYPVPYEVLDRAEGEWILVNATVPDGDYSLNVLSQPLPEGTASEPDSGPLTEESPVPFVFEVPYAEGLEPDFSNLIIQYAESGGAGAEIPFTVLGFEAGVMANVSPERAPLEGEEVSFLAGQGAAEEEAAAEDEEVVVEEKEPAVPDDEPAAEEPTAEPPGQEPADEGNGTVSAPEAPESGQDANETDVIVDIEDYLDITNTTINASAEAPGEGAEGVYAEIEDYLCNVSDDTGLCPENASAAVPGLPAPDTRGLPYEIRDAGGAIVDADIEFTPKGKPRGGSQAEAKAYEGGGLAPGDYHVTIKPKNHPIESITLDDVPIDEGTGRLIDIDAPMPDSIRGPPGTSFASVYAVNPVGGSGGTLRVKAKGSSVYKCADWDFESRVCLGEWINILNVTPGEYYTVDFTASDPAYGEGSGVFTLTTITIDGNFDDWSTVLSNPNNVMSDGIGGIDDLDTPSTPNRDLTLYAFTWDGNYLYSYFRRTTSGSNVAQLLLYIDADNNGRLNGTDRVVRYSWQNSRQWDSTIFPYSPINASGGDPITGDGTPEPGTVSGTGTALESNILGGDTSNIFLEARLNWSALGLAPGSPVNFHVSAAQGAGTNLPSQVEDNINKTNTSIYAVRIAPARYDAGENGDTVAYNHTVTNLGNYNDTININTSGTLPGFTVVLAYANGTILTDTNGDSVVDVGSVAPGSSINITVSITIAGASNGAVDYTTVAASSAAKPAAASSVVDTTYVGAVVIYPSNEGKVTNATVILFNHTVLNNVPGNKVIEVRAVSNNSYIVNVTFANGTYLTDTDADTYIDIGQTAKGAETPITVLVSIPANASVGTLDTTTIFVFQGGKTNVNSTVIDTTRVARAITIEPNRSNYIAARSGFVYYSHTVCNNQNFTDAADITNRSSQNWTVAYFRSDMLTPLNDTNGNGIPDTGNLSAFGACTDIWIRISIPAGITVAVNTTDYTNITANSTRNSSIWDRVTDNSTARLMLFYLEASHTNVSTIFNRSSTVYANTVGLSGIANVYYQWYDSNGTLIRTSPTIPVDASLQAGDTLTLNSSSLPGMYTAYIRRANNNNEITHDFFYVIDSPNVTVVSPNGGELWSGSRTILYNISDESGKNVSITLQFSPNNGISWQNVTSLTLNTSNCTGNPALQCVQGQFNYTWNTSGASDGAQCLVRVLANNTFVVGSDASNAVFTIDNTPPQPEALAPQNYSLDPDGTVFFSCNVSENIALSNLSLFINGALNQTRNVSGQSNQSDFNLTGLPDGNYTWYCNATDRAGNANAAAAWLLDVNRSAVPIATNFTNKTNWTGLPNLRSVCNGTAYVDAPDNGSVRWFDCVDVSFQNFDVNVRILNNLSIVLFGLNPTFNTTAEIVLRNLSWDFTPTVLMDGNECDPAVCQNISYNLTTKAILFNVTHFTNYSTTGASQLTIWDQNDSGMPGGNRPACVNKQIRFFANYSKKTDNSPILGANCTIRFNDSVTAQMAYNSTSTFYEYNRTFSTTGPKPYNVTCSGLQTITLSDTINITQCMCPEILSPTIFNQSENYYGAPNNASPVSGYACVKIASSNVVYDCRGYNITGDSNATATFGILLNGSLSNITLLNCPSVSNYTGGIYAFNSTNITLSNLTVRNNTNGISLSNSPLANISGVNATNNSNTGMLLNASSGLNNLSYSWFCGNGMDVQNYNSTNSGRLDHCDSFLGWSENDHYGCEYSCSSLWHRFFGNASGTIVLGNNTTYVYSWNATAFNMYFTDSDSVISWQSLQAIGRDTSNASSSNDFLELDAAFGTSSFPDNITSTFSSDGSTPLATRNFTVYGRDIANVPIANSTRFNTTFRTGILWDTSDGGTQYANSFNQSTVWVVKVNSSSADTYGTYDFLGQIPYTLATREGGNSVISVYVELK